MLSVEQLEDRSVPSAAAVAALGDSLSALSHSYNTPNWVQELTALRPGQVSVVDLAKSGATSADLLAQRQPENAVALYQQGRIQGATLEVGANDAKDAALAVAHGQPAQATWQGFIRNTTDNVERAADTLLAGGLSRVVLCDVPDISVTPAVRAELTDPAQLAALSSAIHAVNDNLKAFGAARHLHGVDLEAMAGLAGRPLALGGVTVNNLLASDGFHAGPVLSGLIANAIIDAFHVGYGVSVTGLALSDQEILSVAGVPHDPTLHTFFDVSPYVL
jgi:lysophospholipase L1-like esterase